MTEQAQIPSGKITLGGHDPAYLASFQKHQGSTNDCAAYSIGAAFSLLRGGQRVDYVQVARFASRRTSLHWGMLAGLVGILFGRGLRLWPGGPITPHQQANLAKTLARQRKVRLDASVKTGSLADLLAYLKQPNTAVLVTLAWDDEYLPRIAYPNGTMYRFGKVDSLKLGPVKIRYPFAAHVVLLAAYDPGRTAQIGNEVIHTPWGFINSWMDDADDLFWLPEYDLLKAWGYNIRIGSNKIVVITTGDETNE